VIGEMLVVRGALFVGATVLVGTSADVG
jgi:hypothetical protein